MGFACTYCGLKGHQWVQKGSMMVEPRSSWVRLRGGVAAARLQHDRHGFMTVGERLLQVP